MPAQRQDRIFITGATGFLGSYVLRYLVRQGYSNITALKRERSRMNLVEPIQDKVNWVNGDVLDIPLLYDMCKDHDIVIHVAGLVSFDPRDFIKLMQVNFEGTRNIVNACLEGNVKRLLHTSSTSAVGIPKIQRILDEKVPWSQDGHTSFYSISKYQAEMEVWRGMEEGLNAVIVNPPIMLGSGFWNEGTCKIFQQVYKGLKYFPVGKNSFTDVRDVARYIVGLLNTDISSERILLCGENMTYKDLLTQMANALGKKPPHLPFGKFIRETLWRLEALRTSFFGGTPLLTRKTVHSSASDQEWDNSKSLKLMPGFSYTSLKNVIQEACEGMLRDKEKSVPGSYLEFDVKKNEW
jgi:nucleoside-diphosphate-sugar epimerase